MASDITATYNFTISIFQKKKKSASVQLSSAVKALYAIQHLLLCKNLSIS